MEASARTDGRAADCVFRPSPGDDAQMARLDEALRGTSAERGGIEMVLPEGGRITLPEGMRQIMTTVAHELATGNSVAVVPIHHELTTHQAAALLHVSRPYLIGMLDRGRLPYRKVGTHRRIRYDDVMALRATQEAERERLLARISTESQHLGLEF